VWTVLSGGTAVVCDPGGVGAPFEPLAVSVCAGVLRRPDGGGGLHPGVVSQRPVVPVGGPEARGGGAVRGAL